MKDRRITRREFLIDGSLGVGALLLAACTPKNKNNENTLPSAEVPEIMPLSSPIQNRDQYNSLKIKTMYAQTKDPNSVQVLFNEEDPNNLNNNGWTGWTLRLERTHEPFSGDLSPNVAQELPDNQFEVVKELGSPQFTPQDAPELHPHDVPAGKYLLRMDVRPPGNNSWDSKENPNVEHYYSVWENTGK